MEKNISKTKKIIIAAFCLALALIMGRFKIILFNGTVKLTFGGVFYRFAGMILGPMYSFIIAFFSEMLGAILNPVGSYIFLLSVTEGLQGLLVGLIWRILDKNKLFKRDLVKLFICVGLPGLLINFINSFVLRYYLLWADEIFLMTVLIRLGKEFVMILLNVFVLKAMLELYRNKIKVG